jgi:hypothetical protein
MLPALPLREHPILSAAGSCRHLAQALDGDSGNTPRQWIAAAGMSMTRFDFLKMA